MTTAMIFRAALCRRYLANRVAVALAGGIAFLLLLGAGPAAAEAGAPQWTVSAVSTPTNFDPAAKAGEDFYQVLLTNTGGAASDGTPVKLTDDLPAGLSLGAAGAFGENELAQLQHLAPQAGFSCTLRTCTYTGTVIPDQTLVFTFPVALAAGPLLDTCVVPADALACLTNVVHVSGGGAPAAAVSTPTAISEHPAGFGIAPGGASTALSTLQAGAHPDLTNSLAFNSVDAIGSLAGDPKDVTYDLPSGYAGDLVDTPSCPDSKFILTECPIGTQIGVTTASLGLNNVAGERFTDFNVVPVYNLSPDPGEAGKIGFLVKGQFQAEGGVSVRRGRGGGYGLRTTFHNVNQTLAELDNISLTIWGVPADPIHDPLRFRSEGLGLFSPGNPSDAPLAPFFTNPTSCGSPPLQSSFTAAPWAQPQSTVTETMFYGPLVGCDRLSIEPKLEAQPNADSAETATGLNVDLQSPQHYENPAGLVSSHLDDVKVTLPAGMSLNPSAGSGLGDCTEAQLEYEGESVLPGQALGCPNESKIGSVDVKSPALAEEASGSLFVAKPFDNPFHSLLALYLVARIPNRGVVVTAAGEVHADPATGQLTTTFDENPQLPFSDFTLAFHQGATSPLVTPAICGTFTSNAALTPWSVPSQEHFLTSPFQIISGVGGGPCPSGATPPFHPHLEAGSVNNAAGHYTPFYVRLSREDGEQEITHFSIKLPPGVIGKLAGIPECSDAAIAQAKAREHEQGGAQEEAAPSCPAASEVGRTLVEAGVGSVLAQAPGKLYLAGPYHGAPISIVAITAAHVGPFDLGTVVIRQALRVNPETGEVFIDATGSDPIPHIVDGIPVHARQIRVYVDRPEFTLNPTSCEPTSTASTVLGSGKDFVSEADDQPLTVTSPFQAADCAALPFKPKLKLALKGSTKRGGNPALRAHLQMNGIGEAGVAYAQVALPPTEFLDNAHVNGPCTRVQFKEGAIEGEKCPPTSIIGHAKAVTPLLSEALEGPVYLRSNPERSLPDIAAALHGQEISVVLVGHTDSAPGGGLRNTFEVVPDAPVTSFDLDLLGGNKGLLENAPRGTATSICGTALKATVKFKGHNGKLSNYTDPIHPAGCHKHKKHHKRHHH